MVTFSFLLFDGGAMLSFRARIIDNPETLAEFEKAWERRYIEGLRLLEDDDTRAGGVYLLGYVAEMILKVAYFRLIGAHSEETLDALLTTNEFRYTVKGLNVDTEFYHNPLFWTELLVFTRNQNKRQLPVHLGTSLLIYTSVIHVNWKVDMRYHSLAPTAQEWRDVREAVEWFHRYHDSLWR